MGKKQSTCAAAAQAVAALGLISTWSGDASASLVSDETVSALNNSATIVLNGSLTLELANSVSLFTENSTVTIDPPSPSTGTVSGGLEAGQFAAVPLTLTNPGYVGASSRFSFAGQIDNGDGTSDLVLAFAGDGAAAVGVAWTSIFVDNIADDRMVFEPQVLQQISSPPVFDSAGFVERGSQLDRLDIYYRELLTSAWGETATLIAFNGAGNTGVVVGTITATPAPGTAALLALGALPLSRRRRG
ncbi:MAG: hypothetical protein AAF297_10280 [Planctomycetota bacterium]